jgi:hypothetical protein
MLTRLICALGLLVLGLAHQAPSLAAEPLYNSDEYTLPDGSFASLCVTVKDDAGKHLPMGPNCEVCRLAASIILPAPDAAGWLRLDFASFENVLTSDLASLPVRAVAQPKSRGPPVPA